MMPEHDLRVLLRSMAPLLHEPVYVFATLAAGEQPPSAWQPVLRFQEVEGLTLIVERDAAAAAGIAGVFPCRWITLDVRSALDAVGFLAAVTARLACQGISVNPVAGFHHDHLFVPVDRAGDALQALRELAAENRGDEDGWNG